ncbi:hydroxyacylglutathione hydrolase [Colwellia sp. E2M01]|uniref:hydroxyacylglutathione hydrolase n=1 Tax=Colwellia sp. E2M01 TaxID=2841561 RepID=UPI001C099BA6|nr:hydroxyacylglutathione hydrolase [Colwellia sp. E2M01]MBU2870838.1 hydroxyacylglutathione hydrolase [Colwellia sp. E2M01]
MSDTSSTEIAPTVNVINAFNDNYIWVISHQNTNEIAIVDPGDADVCIAYLQKNNSVLSSILITHHHNDHIGGIAKLLAYAKDNAWPVTVYGPANDGIKQLDITLKENDIVTLASINCQFRVIDLPGHTHGHIAYFNESIVDGGRKSQPILFCGDTLFSGGCGRVFEGTPKQMHHSLTKLAQLPSNTLVYCAHEYTQANLTFALAVDPENNELQTYVEAVKNKRQQHQATIPSNIALELTINPFLRCNTQTIKNAAQKFTNNHTSVQSEVDVFTVIRAWKDNF